MDAEICTKERSKTTEDLRERESKEMGWLHRQTGPEKRVNLKLILYYNMLSG